ncbi:MAG: dihydropteroate synthase [Chthoniobacterales bacterium]
MSATLWKIAGRTLDVSRRGMIMGVVNVTPDSFSDAGEFFDPQRAVEHARQMVDAGAQIIDLGGESTRPGATPVSAEQEIRRVLPVISELRKQTSTPISIDTMKAEVARAALETGASIINDVSGGRADQAMLPLAARSGAAIVLMHMQGTPQTMQIAPHYEDVVAEVADFFRQQYSCAIGCGIDPMAMAFDPGIGFGKTFEHNLELLRNLSKLRCEDRPLVLGVSRKGFIGKLIGSSAIVDRRPPTIAFTALLRERGANVLRVHDVAENAAALRVAETMLECSA